MKTQQKKKKTGKLRKQENKYQLVLRAAVIPC